MTTIEIGRRPARPETQSVGWSNARRMLECGVLSSLLYVATDILAGLRYDGYRFMSQAVSELEAIGAPSRAFVIPLFLMYGVLIAAFGFGVWKAADGKRAVRAMGGLLIGIGVVGLVATPFAPMHMRGAAGTLTDAVHIILTSVTVVCILLAIGFGASAFGRSFRVYSIATIAVLVLCGALAGRDGARLAAQQPTPWLGLTERVNIYGYLLWVAVLSTVLVRGRSSVVAARD